MYKSAMTKRGNAGKKLLTVYLDPIIIKNFKLKTTMEGENMTKVVERWINDYLAGKKQSQK